MGNFVVNYNAGGVIDEVKKVSYIKGFASYSNPYSFMHKYYIPALNQMFEYEIPLLDQDMEMVTITITCTGYGEDDNYDILVNDNFVFNHWYCSEVKEGLYIGTSSYVYFMESNSKMRLRFRNNSGTAKSIYVGIRLLIDKPELVDGAKRAELLEQESELPNQEEEKEEN